MKYAPFCLLALLAVGCGGNTTEPGVFGTTYGKDSRTEVAADRAVKSLKAGVAAQFVEGSNRLGYQLLKAQDLSKNTAISPLGVALGMLVPLNAAEGTTLAEMQKTLGVEKILLEDVNQAADQTGRALGGLNSDTLVRIGNSIFAHQDISFSEEFKSEQQSRFGANFRTLDFGDVAAKNAINEWAKKATDGRITAVVSKTDPAKPVLLVNTMFVSAPLKAPFASASTKNAPFALADGKSAETPMMMQTGSFSAKLGDDAVVRLPYRGDQLELVMALPPKGKSLGEWAVALDMKAFVAALPSKAQVIELAVPRFELSPTVSLVGGLQKAGVQAAFGEKADLKKMGVEHMVIHEAIQKTWLMVEETAPAAPTGAKPEATPKASGKVAFDRPFLVFVRDLRTGQVLLAGAVCDPRPVEMKG